MLAPSPSALDPAFWAGRRVLLTGHTGFKGSWLSLWLMQMGARVTGVALNPDTSPNLFDVLDLAAAGLPGKLHDHRLDIRDAEGLAVLVAAAAPEVVLHDGQVHMLYQRLIGQSYQLYLAASADGEHFVDVVDRPVFGPAAGGWDSLSITTSRVSREGDWFYMIYGGSAYLADEPDYFGLARSRNLIDWERHPGNPVFGCGAKGTPDGGALWFPALVQTEDSFVMLYEGSRGKYSWDLSSAICLADIPRT